MDRKDDNITLEQCIGLAADNYFDEIEKRASEDKTEFSEKHKKEIEKIIEKSKKVSRKKPLKKFTKRIAVILIAAATAVTALTVTAEDYKIRFAEIFLNTGKGKDNEIYTTEETTEETTAAEQTTEPLTEAETAPKPLTEAETEYFEAEPEPDSPQILIESLDTAETAEKFKAEAEYNYEILSKMGIDFTEEMYIGTPFTMAIQQKTLTEEIQEIYSYCFPIIKDGLIKEGFTVDKDTGKVNGLLLNILTDSDYGANINDLADGRVYAIAIDSDNNNIAFSEGEIILFDDEAYEEYICLAPPYENVETVTLNILEPIDINDAENTADLNKP